MTSFESTTVKERPILFSGAMIRAIVSGAKTQTRWIVKPQPIKVVDDPESFERYPYTGGETTLLVGHEKCPSGFRSTRWFTFDADTNAKIEYARPGVYEKATPARLRKTKEWQRRSNHGQRWSESEVLGLCPFGTVGERIWVRETWRCTGGGDWRGVIYKAEENDGRIEQFREAYKQLGLDELGRKSLSSNLVPEWERLVTETKASTGWRRSIHMPRWASRITLEITSVRVERLHEISEEDAICEGVESCNGSGLFKHYLCNQDWVGAVKGGWCRSAADSFETLWESINGEGSWAANPWVWCISFRRVA